MLELLIPLKNCLKQSAYKDMACWFRECPKDASWYVISDYSFGDKNKKNDVVSFSVLLCHDTLYNIKEYISAFAPKDIKNTRTVSKGFIQYLNSPVIFHFSFIIDRNTKFMRNYADVDNMKSFLPEFSKIVDWHC